MNSVIIVYTGMTARANENENKYILSYLAKATQASIGLCLPEPS